MQIFQNVVFSNFSLSGFYKYKDIFQIYPVERVKELYIHDHPIYIQYKFDEAVFPERSGNFWHRDIWEANRYEYIRRRSKKCRMDSDDEWVKAYQLQAKQLRIPAILVEISVLLTTFTNVRFFFYDISQSWGQPFNNENKRFDTNSCWVSLGYSPTSFGQIDKFSDLDLPNIPIIESKQYIKRFRDTFGYSEGKNMEFPEYIDGLLDTYFLLSDKDKLGFYQACHLYAQALNLKHRYPSLSFVAAVMGIEKLIGLQEKMKSCEKCGAPIPKEKCDSCGMGIYKIRSKFIDFMCKYNEPKNIDIFKKMYNKRSQLSHGGLLKADLFDSGFHAGEKDDEQRLHDNGLIVVHDAIKHWIISIHNSRISK